MSTQPNLSNENSDFCMAEPLSIILCSRVAEHSVMSEPSVFGKDISAIEPVYPR